MGRKLDLSGLTDRETEHVLQVVQRDFSLRKKEEERLSEMKQRLAEEGSKCRVLARHRRFVDACCMRCCAPFTFLLNPRRRCGDCKFNVCKSCCAFHKREKAWVCGVCQQARLLRTQSLEWFYSNVKSRFKRFGSAKVLENLYRKHRLESGFGVLGGGCFESNPENEGSVSGSDSTFYRQPEGHSMMDTLAVALRVAEEAIEEAISKAEAHGDSLDKQSEACYLRGHKEELTEELATAILQKIMRKQKSKSEPQVEGAPCWPQPPSCRGKDQRQGSAASPGGPASPAALHRSQSAFSFQAEDALKASPPEAASWARGQHAREESTLPGWRSTDGLDGAEPARVLQSPDGNWVALKEGAVPPARLLARSKSGAFQALEVASSVASAYEEMGSDSEEDLDWSDAVSKLCLQPQGPPGSPSPLPAQAHPEATCSDSETSSAGSSRDAGRRARLSWLQKRPPGGPLSQGVHPQVELDENFNPPAAHGETSDSSEPEEAPQAADRRARRWRRPWRGSEEPSRERACPRARVQDPHLHQVSGDLAETDACSEVQPSQTGPEATEDTLKTRLYELALKMSERETSSGEDPESERRAEHGKPQGGPGAEDSQQGLRDELKKKYSAVSLCNISTEVLKVINATEELIESARPWDFPPVPPDTGKGTFPLGTDPVRLDEQLTSLEENVYLAAGTVYGLESQLAELEDAARSVHSGSEDTELAELEDQVAAAAAQVHHAELQISDIESRISALTLAGLNIAPCIRFARRQEQKQRSQVQTIDTSRQQRRKLPAPPVPAEKADPSSVTAAKTFNRNFAVRSPSTSRPQGRRSRATAAEPAPEPAGAF